MARTRIDDPTLPNLTDDRANHVYGPGPHRLFWYARATDGAVIVGTMFAGQAKGFSPTGRRYESLEAATQAVREARELVAAHWTRQGWPCTFTPLVKEG